MDYPICPSCKGENTYHDSIQFVCPDCGHEWTGNEAEEHDDDQLNRQRQQRQSSCGWR